VRCNQCSSRIIDKGGQLNRQLLLVCESA
jgi:DNA-directed RNA polymerase subunit RPC12/RpoP